MPRMTNKKKIRAIRESTLQYKQYNTETDSSPTAQNDTFIYLFSVILRERQ